MRAQDGPSLGAGGRSHFCFRHRRIPCSSMHVLSRKSFHLALHIGDKVGSLLTQSRLMGQPSVEQLPS